jgi:hypothetical protein
MKVVDSLSRDQCHKIIKEICTKLQIASIDKLIRSLESIAVSLRTIPKMQQFIQTVDHLIWAGDKDEFLFDTNQGMHPVSQTLQKLQDLCSGDAHHHRNGDRDFHLVDQFRQLAAQAVGILPDTSLDILFNTVLNKLKQDQPTKSVTSPPSAETIKVRIGTAHV